MPATFVAEMVFFASLTALGVLIFLAELRSEPRREP
jgi:hypothetical protein